MDLTINYIKSEKDLIIEFNDFKVQVNLEQLSNYFDYFGAKTFIESGGNILKAEKIFYNENVLLDCIMKTQLLSKYNLSITGNNIMIYFHLCDILMANNKFVEYIIIELNKINHQILCSNVYSYCLENKVKLLELINIEDHKETFETDIKYCFQCKKNENKSKYNICFSCFISLNLFILILTWSNASSKYNLYDIKNLRRLLIDNFKKYKDIEVPLQAKEFLFIMKE